jgi:hypothetical protein
MYKPSTEYISDIDINSIKMIGILTSLYVVNIRYINASMQYTKPISCRTNPSSSASCSGKPMILISGGEPNEPNDINLIVQTLLPTFLCIGLNVVYVSVKHFNLLMSYLYF